MAWDAAIEAINRARAPDAAFMVSAARPLCSARTRCWTMARTPSSDRGRAGVTMVRSSDGSVSADLSSAAWRSALAATGLSSARSCRCARFAVRQSSRSPCSAASASVTRATSPASEPVVGEVDAPLDDSLALEASTSARLASPAPEHPPRATPTNPTAASRISSRRVTGVVLTRETVPDRSSSEDASIGRGGDSRSAETEVRLRFVHRPGAVGQPALPIPLVL
jgi:hypothetical protein